MRDAAPHPAPQRAAFYILPLKKTDKRLQQEGKKQRPKHRRAVFSRAFVRLTEGARDNVPCRVRDRVPYSAAFFRKKAESHRLQYPAGCRPARAESPQIQVFSVVSIVFTGLLSGTPLKALYASILILLLQQVDSLFIVPRARLSILRPFGVSFFPYNRIIHQIPCKKKW